MNTDLLWVQVSTKQHERLLGGTPGFWCAYRLVGICENMLPSMSISVFTFMPLLMLTSTYLIEAVRPSYYTGHYNDQDSQARKINRSCTRSSKRLEYAPRQVLTRQHERLFGGGRARYSGARMALVALVRVVITPSLASGMYIYRKRPRWKRSTTWMVNLFFEV